MVTLSDYEFAMTKLFLFNNMDHKDTYYLPCMRKIFVKVFSIDQKSSKLIYFRLWTFRETAVWGANIDDIGWLAGNHEVSEPVNFLDSNFEIAMNTVRNTCALLSVACRILWASYIVFIQISKLWCIQCEIHALCYWSLAGLRHRTVEGQRNVFIVFHSNFESRLCYYTMLKRVFAHNHRNCSIIIRTNIIDHTCARYSRRYSPLIKKAQNSFISGYWFSEKWGSSEG